MIRSFKLSNFTFQTGVQNAGEQARRRARGWDTAGWAVWLKGDANNVFQCKGNLATELQILTSGYYEGEQFEKPSNGIKCSHGGFMDYSTVRNAIGGINKDSADAVISPHNYQHSLAANVAIQATIDFMQQLRSDLNNEQFERFLGIEHGPTLAFVIDTTGSMEPYIDAAIARSEAIIDHFLQDATERVLRYILVPFNDPFYGPLFETKDAAEFKAQLESLYAYGGGDKPEMCMHGISLAAEAADKVSTNNANSFKLTRLIIAVEIAVERMNSF